MQVGDLVIFPCGEVPPPMGIIMRTKPDGVNRGTPGLRPRAKVYWVRCREISWEPIKWLEVVSASR